MNVIAAPNQAAFPRAAPPTKAAAIAGTIKPMKDQFAESSRTRHVATGIGPKQITGVLAALEEVKKRFSSACFFERDKRKEEKLLAVID
ncbi:hypothetical protein [Caballeronia sp. AZ7_KS35]|uniref:hypothetical protein n=1 Tax=Caballeronia sp. AZ7_KS35 TaxID=2921762 RepID=UPI0020283D01|nr:hypothetical protein [Caballeronia sp. AZ7_KS35]